MNSIKTLADNRLIRYMVLILVSLVSASAYLSMEGLFAMEIAIRDPQGLYQISDNEFGALSGAYSLLVVFGGVLIGGIFVDKTGIRKSGTVSTLFLIAGASLVLYSMVKLRMELRLGNEIPCIRLLGQEIRRPILYGIVGFALFGAGSEVIGVVLTKILNKWFKKKEQAFALASQVAVGRLGIGAAYGGTPYLLAFFNGNVPIPLIIGVGLLVFGLGLFILYCFIDKRLDAQYAKAGMSIPQIDESDQFRWSDLGVIARCKAFWAICLICGFYYGAVRKFDNFSVKFVVDCFDIEEKAGGILPLLTSWTVVILSPLMGIFVDRQGKSLDMLVLGSSLAVIDFFLLGTVPLSKSMVYVVFILNGISFSLVSASLWPLIDRVFPLSIQGTAYACVFFFQNIVFLIVPNLVSFVGTATPDYVFVFLGSAVFAALFSILFMHIDKKSRWGLNQKETEVSSIL